MAEEKKAPAMPHNLILEDRRTLTVSGVSDVDSFDEQTVVVFTDMGELTVRGTDLHIMEWDEWSQKHINRLSVEVGELLMEGHISSLTYTDEPQKGGGFFSKVFR